MDFKQSILKRFPNLTENDFGFIDRNDGNGVVFEFWNGEELQPTIEQVKQWNDEDAQLPKPPTIEERISELENLQNLQLLGVL